MGQAQPKYTNYSIEEWLALEAAEGERYEYHFGEVFAMAGGTVNHARIGRNALLLLDRHFAESGQDCEAFQADLKVEIQVEKRYVYPDTLAVCGPIEESTTLTGAIKNPILVVEVISESSEAYDRGMKFNFYRKLRSVREYLLIDQFRIGATLYRRGGVGELFRREDFEGGAARLRLESVGLEFTLSELYRNVTFTEAAEEADEPKVS